MSGSAALEAMIRAPSWRMPSVVVEALTVSCLDSPLASDSTFHVDTPPNDQSWPNSSTLTPLVASGPAFVTVTFIGRAPPAGRSALLISAVIETSAPPVTATGSLAESSSP